MFNELVPIALCRRQPNLELLSHSFPDEITRLLLACRKHTVESARAIASRTEPGYLTYPIVPLSEPQIARALCQLRRVQVRYDIDRADFGFTPICCKCHSYGRDDLACCVATASEQNVAMASEVRQGVQDANAAVAHQESSQCAHDLTCIVGSERDSLGLDENLRKRAQVLRRMIKKARVAGRHELLIGGVIMRRYSLDADHVSTAPMADTTVSTSFSVKAG